jgi:hypothetical protein
MSTAGERALIARVSAAIQREAAGLIPGYVSDGVADALAAAALMAAGLIDPPVKR